MSDLIYAVDIETSTDGPDLDGIPFGLDPRRSPVISAAVWDQDADSGVVFIGDELDVLTQLDQHLAALPAGLVVTWNGANFDLPYLTRRAETLGLDLGLTISMAADRLPKYSSLPGFGPGGYYATWYEHGHLDAAFAYKPIAEQLGTSWGLKPVATALGFDMIEVDRADMAALTREELEEYNLSDVRGTAALAARLTEGEMARWVDPPLS